MGTKMQFVAAAVCSVLVTTSTSQAATLYACVKKVGGAVRMVSKAAVCAPDEVKRSWVDAKSFTALQTRLNSGLIIVEGGHGSWVKFADTDPLTITRYSDKTQVTRSSTGASFISMHPTIPSVLYGKSVQLLGVEFCCTASTSAVLSYVEISTTMASDSAGSRVLQFSDGTDYTDAACRYYVLPAPVTLTPEMSANLFAQVNWTVADSTIYVGRATFVLKATNTAAVAPTAISENVVLLQEGAAPDVPSTASPN